MAIGNRGMRRRLFLAALAGLGYYILYSAGRLDPFFNAHSCAAREFYSLQLGSCAPCAACHAGQEVVMPCLGTSDTKCRTCRPGAEYLLGATCTPCSACPINESTLRACDGSTDTVCSHQSLNQKAKLDIAGFHDTSDKQMAAELHDGTVLPPTSLPPQDHAAAAGISGPASNPDPLQGASSTTRTSHHVSEDIQREAKMRFAKRAATPKLAATPSTPVQSPLSPAPPTQRNSPAAPGSEADDTSWKPVFGRTTTGPLIPNTKDWIEDGWGADCYSDNNMDVLVALPYSPKMVSNSTA